MKDVGWDILLDEVTAFCSQYEVEVPNMDAIYVLKGKSKRKIPNISHLHHCKVDLFYSVVSRVE